ncbi:integrator complex subunit 7-like [Haliotis rufescens]|uniref:integrator complex subunit 7-like n=1 Tax=Haliotis rufescens TaxID=6454 RepID=UPI00201EB49A|nr:integrator complex subunit 7-like [Haliotis rufescens]
MAASIVGVRNVNPTLDGVSAEQEQDANSALTELDKGLRSNRIGLQCEAVVKYPRLFEKYPFPILINSALLKLADVFREGNNFIRLCILKVTQQSGKHLDKILNVDEFVRRIFSVIHSNDPVARAITLRTLGSIAGIISERKNVHHSIKQSLDSHDMVEVEAAMFAADRFAKESKTFAASICGKIADMICSIATPVNMKLKLIPIMQHMHHDVTTAAKTRDICLSLLESFPAENLVVVTLHTMSQLAAFSLYDLQEQVQFLLTFLNQDPRHGVKVIVLQDLRLLAKKGPHLWTSGFIETLCQFVLATPSVKLKVGGVSVLTTVFDSVAVQLLPLTSDSKLLDLCQQYCYHDNLILASRTVQLLTQLAKSKRSPIDLIGEAVGCLQTHLILLTGGGGESEQHTELKLCLHCAVELCQTSPTLCGGFVDTIAGLLTSVSDSEAEVLCEALAAIGSSNSQSLQLVVPVIVSCLESSVENTQQITQLQVYMCTLLFQAAGGEGIPNEIHELIVTCAGLANQWLAYKMSRQALRYSQYEIGGDIIKPLTVKVASEHFYHWLMGVAHICSAETRLRHVVTDNANVLQCMSECLELYQKALVSLKAGSSPAHPLKFQCDYVSLRITLLQAHRQLILSCNTFRTAPPPAIATALASTNGQEGTRWSQIVQQLEGSMEQYEELSKKISNVYWSAFDADKASLSNIDILQQSCDSVKAAIMSIISTMQLGGGSFGDRQLWTGGGETIETGVSIETALQNVSSGLNKVLQDTTHDMTSRITFLSDSAKALIKSSHSFPRFFFQTLQSTVLKLAVSPQQNANMEPISIRCDTHLAVKVEGIVQHGERPCLFRTAHSVSISATSTLQSRSTQPGASTKGNEITSNFLTQTVEPHNDYFSVNFLLPFPVLGIHTVTIDASIVDISGAVWQTGPKAMLTIKSYDEVLQRQQQQARYQSRSGTSSSSLK